MSLKRGLGRKGFEKGNKLLFFTGGYRKRGTRILAEIILRGRTKRKHEEVPRGRGEKLRNMLNGQRGGLLRGLGAGYANTGARSSSWDGREG